MSSHRGRRSNQPFTNGHICHRSRPHITHGSWRVGSFPPTPLPVRTSSWFLQAFLEGNAVPISWQIHPAISPGSILKRLVFIHLPLQAPVRRMAYFVLYSDNPIQMRRVNEEEGLGREAYQCRYHDSGCSVSTGNPGHFLSRAIYKGPRSSKSIPSSR